MNFKERKFPRTNTVVQAQGTPESDPKAEVKKEPASPQSGPTEAANDKVEAPAQEDLQDTKR